MVSVAWHATGVAKKGHWSYPMAVHATLDCASTTNCCIWTALTGKTSLSRLPVAVMAMCKSTQARLMEFGSCWKQRSQSNCLAKLLRRLNWIRLSGDTLGAGNGAGRSKKLEPLCWKPLESSWLKWLNCRNVVVVKLKTQEKTEIEDSELTSQQRSRPYCIVIINDFGVTIGNRLEIVLFFWNKHHQNCAIEQLQLGRNWCGTRSVSNPAGCFSRKEAVKSQDAHGKSPMTWICFCLRWFLTFYHGKSL